MAPGFAKDPERRSKNLRDAQAHLLEHGTAPAQPLLRNFFFESRFSTTMLSNRTESYPVDSQDPAQMSCKIYVGNLAWATDENALGSHFANIGEVKGAVVMRTEGRSRGFGFVTFATPEQAKRAIETMYDSELMVDAFG
ncbi:hypothetical protein PCASD_09053 [Puccinia coronata f. sp. avenae]|uniref:RRM domain-containing protein n=1 Tax=Puccinia coronata f. sp. avenae TaxID=200324 RepID=A0A2N5UIS9_9BASI|nr:hypothetical protein PCASD_09053 [Puccinia coronata f. sp. avenae]